MAKQFHYTYSDDHYMELDVSASDLVITVTEGSTTFFNTPRILVDDETFTVGTYASTAVVTGWLVLDRTDNDTLRVFVDTYLLDGVDTSYDFARSGDYELLATLFVFTVPPGTTNLDSLTWHYWAIIPEPG